MENNPNPNRKGNNKMEYYIDVRINYVYIFQHGV